MNELKFRAEWKRGIEPRPVKTFRQLTASVTDPPDFAVPLGVRECWIFSFCRTEQAAGATLRLSLVERRKRHALSDISQLVSSLSGKLVKKPFPHISSPKVTCGGPDDQP